MAKQGAMGMQFFIDGYTIGGDTQQVDKIAAPLSALEFTDITQFGHERKIGLRDGQVDTTHFLNVAAARAHAALSPLPTTDRITTAAIPTATALAIGDPVVSLLARQLNYDPTRAQDGSLLFKVSATADGFGLEWGRLATAGLRSDTTATNGTGLDLGTDPSATVSFGLQAYLQVVSFTGTSVAIKLQGSSDNGSGDAFADVVGGAFASVTTAPQSQRIATSAVLAVERYVRVVTTGTFSECTFLVQVSRNTVATVF